MRVDLKVLRGNCLESLGFRAQGLGLQVQGLGPSKIRCKLCSIMSILGTRVLFKYHVSSCAS